jgi:putative PIN family toxin of toxin-antitoxin system
MLRVTLDTNVFVSSLLTPRGASAQVLDAWRKRQYLLVISLAILAEIQTTLNYPHIRNKYFITDKDIRQLTTLLEKDALLVPGEAVISDVTLADPKDVMVLACAVDGQADWIVSGDHHLLELGEYQGISILAIRQFLERLSA